MIRAGLGSAGVQAANRLLALALAIVLARALGAEGYGVYAHAFAILMVLVLLAEAGVPKLLLREVAASEGRQDWGLLRGAVRRAGQFVGLVAFGVSAVGLLVLWSWSDGLARPTLYTSSVMLLMVPLLAWNKSVTHALRGLRYVVLGEAVERLARPAVALVLVAALFLLWPALRQPHVAMAAQGLAAALVLLLGYLLLRHRLQAAAGAAEPAYRSGAWLRSALPFTLIGGAGIVNNQADIIMLGWFAESEQVGVYRVAVQGATLVTFAIQSANAALAPQFARLHAEGAAARLQALVTASARVILLATLPVAAAFVLAGGAIAGWVFGPEFAAAHVPLAILAAGQLVNAGFGSVGLLLNMTGHETASARGLWQTAALNIVLNAGLIPLYGMVGAAIATGLSVVLWNVLLYRQVRRRLGISPTALGVVSR